MEHIKLAFGITLFYFLTVLVFEKWSHWFAEKISGKRREALIRKIIYYILKISSFFMMVLGTIAVIFALSGNQDLSQTFGLTKAFKRGKVLMRVPAPDNLTAGIIILEPHLYMKNDRYILSFKFDIHKGVKDKQLDLAGGRFIIESTVGGKVVDQMELPVSDQFKITDSDLSGTYVSPQPFSLSVKPESIDLIWEMNSEKGDRISSKPYRIKPGL